MKILDIILTIFATVALMLILTASFVTLHLDIREGGVFMLFISSSFGIGWIVSKLFKI